MLETINSQGELLKHWDAIARGLNRAIKKINSGNATAEQIMFQMVSFVESPHGFILAGFSPKGQLEGILFAYAVTEHFKTPWIELPILWTEPGVGKRELFRGFDMLLTWAKGLGATDIYIAVMRSPKALMKHFYSRLGFETAGLIARRRI